uniref:Activin types I and II receptor domain-containing protein n=1 Tax=Acrobeloides nanus TaxID=290746 RepID=A0A914DYI9_9BILA
MSFLRLGRSQSILLNCFNCSNYPTQVVCGAKTSCQGSGCYTVIEQGLESQPRVASGCSNNLSLTNRTSACYQDTPTRKLCVCFTDLCNTQLSISSYGTLNATPFSSPLLLPWASSTPNTTTVIAITATTAATVITGSATQVFQDSAGTPGTTTTVVSSAGTTGTTTTMPTGNTTTPKSSVSNSIPSYIFLVIIYTISLWISRV